MPPADKLTTEANRRWGIVAKVLTSFAAAALAGWFSWVTWGQIEDATDRSKNEEFRKSGSRFSQKDGQEMERRIMHEIQRRDDSQSKMLDRLSSIEATVRFIAEEVVK
jgi:hypothetical protein